MVGSRFPTYGAYAAGKGAVEAVTMILARELRGPANFKVPAGTVDDEDKRKIVEHTTELYVEIYGERPRATTVVLLDEVTDGGWGVGGDVLTAEMLNSNT